jgi:putative transcriptional regulator
LIRFKIDIIKELNKKGYNTNRIRQDKIISEGALQKIRSGGVPGIKSIDKLCMILKKQPGQLLEYVPDSVPVPESDQE